MKHDVALKTAEVLVEYLRPACIRIEIAGSVRRGKPEVKDIEILAIPDLSITPPKPKLEFGKPLPVIHKTMLNKLLHDLIERDEIRFEKSGKRYKKFTLKENNISVDLFLVLPPAEWGVQFVIRTGPADFSHWIVTQRRYGGALPNDSRVRDGAVWVDGGGGSVPMEEEMDFLVFLGLGWIEPSQREARWTR